MTDAVTTPQSEYIQHHLVNLNSIGGAQSSIVDFSVVNYDSLFWSILTGAVVIYFLWRAASRATTDVPGRFQMSIEMLVDMVYNEAKNIVPNETSRKYAAPLALTIFIWIAIMNSLDLVPVDLMAWIFQMTGLGAEHGDPLYYHKILPTADLNVPLGMSAGVLVLMLYYGIKIHKLNGWFVGLFTSPFHAKGIAGVVLAPFNFLLNIIEYVAKTVSLGMRLFGNMYAGELLFMLIALLGGAWVGFTPTSISLAFGHVLAGTAWAIFHILIILLQAYIFMMLTLVYIGLAHESH